MQTNPNLKSLDEIREMFGPYVARAVEIQRPIKRGRRLGNVFTHEVLVHLYKQHRAPNAPEPLTIQELGEKNGLIEVSQSTIHGLLGRLNLNQLEIEPAADEAPPPTATMEKPMTDSNLFTIEQIEEKFGPEVAAAVRENRPLRHARRYQQIFTKPVCEMLYRKHLADSAPEPLTIDELAQNNRIIKLSSSSVLQRYFRKHKVPTTPLPHRPAPIVTAEPEEEDVVEDTSTVGSPAPMPNGITITPASIPTDFNIVTLPAPLMEPLPAEFTPLVNALGQIISELNGISGVKAKASVAFEWEVA